MAEEHGRKCAILVCRSTTTIMALKPCDVGSSVMKSTEMEAHGRLGTGSGCSSPWGLRALTFVRAHVEHERMYMFTVRSK